MSSSLHVHVGPYVRCVAPPVAAPAEIRSCLNAECPKHCEDRWEHASFCSACGRPITRTTVEVKRRADAYDLIGDELAGMGDRSRTGVEYLRPNHQGPREFCFDDADESDEALDLTDLDRAAEIAWFEKRYAKALAKLRAAFESVDVRWGVRAFYM